MNRGFRALNGGLRGLNRGFVAMNGGFRDLNGRFYDLKGGLRALNGGFVAMKGGFHDLNRGFAAMNGGLRDPNRGLVGMNGGLRGLNRGLPDLNGDFCDLNGVFRAWGAIVSRSESRSQAYPLVVGRPSRRSASDSPCAISHGKAGFALRAQADRMSALLGGSGCADGSNKGGLQSKDLKNLLKNFGISFRQRLETKRPTELPLPKILSDADGNKVLRAPAEVMIFSDAVARLCVRW